MIARDEEVDAEEVLIEAETVRLMALYQPVGSDLRLLCTILKVNNDLERIADCGVNIAERAKHLDRHAVGTQVEMGRQMATVVQADAADGDPGLRGPGCRNLGQGGHQMTIRLTQAMLGSSGAW